MLSKAGLPDSNLYKACIAALPHIYAKAHSSLCISHEEPYLQRPAPPASEIDDEVTFGRCKLFPGVEEVATVLQNFIGTLQPNRLVDIPDGQQILELPQLESAALEICSHCPCDKCLNKASTRTSQCMFERYLKLISHCAKTILLLSLFAPTDADGIQLRYSSIQTRRFNNLTQAIYNMIVNGDEVSTGSILISSHRRRR
jgi:hypothetical protein